GGPQLERARDERVGVVGRHAGEERDRAEDRRDRAARGQAPARQRPHARAPGDHGAGGVRLAGGGGRGGRRGRRPLGAQGGGGVRRGRVSGGGRAGGAPPWGGWGRGWGRASCGGRGGGTRGRAPRARSPRRSSGSPRRPP